MADVTWAGVAVGAGGGVLAWVLSVVHSGAQHDRERLLRHRGLANALLSDVERLATELPPLNPEEIVNENEGPTLPTLHEWLRPLIPEYAAADPEVLRLFLKLERELRQLGTIEAQKRQSLRDREDLYESTRDHLDSEGVFFETKTRRAQLERLADMLDTQHRRTLVKSYESLAALRARLSPLATLEIPGLLAFAIERLLPRSTEDERPRWLSYAGARVPARSSDAPALPASEAAF
ncbi:MAG: hypothetical protein JWL71_436 [Acidobacteria bacterium]|nr:hypothetical protein [Acidobacteriota bacterium]